MQDRVFSTEAVMLRAFGFVLHVEHPHKFVLSLLLLLGLDGPILQEAWNLTNDRCAPRCGNPSACCIESTPDAGCYNLCMRMRSLQHCGVNSKPSVLSVLPTARVTLASYGVAHVSDPTLSCAA